jgi:small subunit ribosomal protein S17
MARGKAKTMIGIVTSNRMDKTVVVEVERLARHERYQKPVRRTSRFKAHDERNECKVGDKVFIIESKPISRTKRWRVSKILESAGAPGVGAIEPVEGEGGIE